MPIRTRRDHSEDVTFPALSISTQISLFARCLSLACTPATVLADSSDPCANNWSKRGDLGACLITGVGRGLPRILIPIAPVKINNHSQLSFSTRLLTTKIAYAGDTILIVHTRFMYTLSYRQISDKDMQEVVFSK